MSALSARIKFCNYRQHEGQSSQDYVKGLSAMHDVVKAIDGAQGVGIDGEVFEEIERMFQIQHGCTLSDPGILERHNDTLSSYSYRLMLANIALRGALPSKCKLLKAELQKQHNLGKILCPETLASVTKVLQKHVGIKGVSTTPKEDPEGVSFYQAEAKQVKGTNGKLHANVACRKCHKKRHYQSYCPFIEEEEEEVEREGYFQVEDPVCLVDSDEEDEVCFYQVMCLMSKKHKEDVMTLSMVVFDT